MAPPTQPPSTFTIPPKWQSSLTFSPNPDTRTDAQLLATLLAPPPITSERNIWAFWHSGVTNMPSWCKRNIYAWIRMNPSLTVRVLDQVPSSPNYALTYIPASMLPKTFIEGTMEGEVTGQHASDFIRGAIIYLYGGVYMDVGCILFRGLERVCWGVLEEGEKRVGCPLMHGQTMANHFVAGRKGDEFVKKWHDLFMHVWKDRTSPNGLIADPLWLPFLPGLSEEVAADGRYNWDFKVDTKTIFEYITQIMCWLRVCHIREPGPNGFDGVTYWKEKVLVWDALSEHWPAEQRLGFTMGQRFMTLMAVKRGDTTSPDWQAAQDLTFELLAHSTMQKVTHGKNLTHDIALGVLLDSSENEGADVEPGTFFELLRYGTINFRQTRESIAYLDPPAPKLVVEKGIQEV